MSKNDPLDPKNVKTGRFNISLDELEARHDRQDKISKAPARKAAEILGDAVYKVLNRLGVDIQQGPEMVKAEQEAMGITVWERNETEQAQLNGFYIHNGYDEFWPFAWVGDAYLDKQGECWCLIWWFEPNIVEKFGGFKVKTK